MTQVTSLNIPSGLTAAVSLIDTTCTIDLIDLEYLLGPSINGVQKLPHMPVFSFLIENNQGRKVLFDLGLRKDYQDLAPLVSASLRKATYEVKVAKDVPQILGEHGYQREDFEAIIWSHQHWDHIGDPSAFPNHVKLVVGPGFKRAYMPGAPARADSPILESDYRDREVVEIDFNSRNCTTIGTLKAYDYFEDGSLYLLDAPGHAISHIIALVRTTMSPDTFVLLGADSIHDIGELRPSPHLPVPETILLHSKNPLLGSSSVCVSQWVEQLQKQRGRTIDQSLFETINNYNISDTLETIAKLQVFDGETNVFVVCSHDEALKGIVAEFPKTLNDWKRKGWDNECRWLFLRHYLPELRPSNENLD